MNDESRFLGNRYRVGKQIGRGGMGDVHLGTDTRLGRTVAIKLLRSQLTEDEDFRRRFRQEAQSAARMSHPNIVRTYDTGEDETVDAHGNVSIVPYIVMEYVEGKTVKDLIRSGALGQNDSIRIMSDVLAALDYAHSAGLVHRDIKPGNVMVSVSGFVKVMDFGVAKAVADSSATVAMTAHIMGTATYFAPEQAKGEAVDARSDLYSAGVMLYEMLTGRPPFQGDSPTAIAYQHVNTAPIPPNSLNPEVSAAVSTVVLTALAKTPDTRYATAKDFADDLLAAAAGREPRHAMALMEANAQVDDAATVIMPSLSDSSTVSFDELLRDATTQTKAPVETTEAKPTTLRRFGPWIAVVVLALAAIGALVWFLLLGSTVNPDAYRVTVADVTGLSQSDAQAQLEGQGLTVTAKKDANATVPSGSVISTNPSAGTDVPKGSAVTMDVSTGPAQVQLPSLKGVALDSAKTRLAALGLVVGEVTTQDGAGLAENVIVSTTPAALSNVAVGTSINIVVSTGKVTIPDVTGKSITEARSTLEALNLTVVAQPLYICSGTDGVVVKQTPSAGKTTQSTSVTLVYNLIDSARCKSPAPPSPSASASSN